VDPRSNLHRTLRWLRGAAERMLDRLPDLPADHPAQRTRKEVVRLATELCERAGMPITIGLVGEFSVGKSERCSVGQTCSTSHRPRRPATSPPSRCGRCRRVLI
jgi:hypothetical protein